MDKHENINPEYYSRYKEPIIKFIQWVVEPLQGIEAVCVGHILRYTVRYFYKNGTEDLYKARWYLDYLIEYRNAKEDSPKTLEEFMIDKQLDEFHDEE